MLLHSNHSMTTMSIESSRMSNKKRNEISHDLPATFLFVNCKLRENLTIVIQIRQIETQNNFAHLLLVILFLSNQEVL